MADKAEITVGMPVFGADKRPLGVVEAVDDEALTVGTLQIPREAVRQVSAGAVHLRVAGTALAARPDYPSASDGEAVATTDDHLVVPVREPQGPRARESLLDMDARRENKGNPIRQP
jgi:hypothetical protein